MSDLSFGYQRLAELQGIRLVQGLFTRSRLGSVRQREVADGREIRSALGDLHDRCGEQACLSDDKGCNDGAQENGKNEEAARTARIAQQSRIHRFHVVILPVVQVMWS